MLHQFDWLLLVELVYVFAATFVIFKNLLRSGIICKMWMNAAVTLWEDCTLGCALYFGASSEQYPKHTKILITL